MTVAASDVAIRYMIGDFRAIGIKDYVIQRLQGKYSVKEFWAVDGISFQLEKGDFLGILGRNGAGKSTFLKAVAGIMRPTRGTLETNGKIAPLLALGAGFDGELTVKENVFLMGALLGYTRSFVTNSYEDIIQYAELEDFQDRPLRQLSTGMSARLAFSIACLVKPDILILDEVLAVGDGAFVQKSSVKMQEVLASGTTTLFVSHSIDAMRKLCNKALWLDKGKQMDFGEAGKVIDAYERFLKGS